MKYLSTQPESERKLLKCKLTLNVGGLPKEITIYDWSTVKELKEEISKAIGVQVSQQRVFYGNIELASSKKINDYRILSCPKVSKSLHVLLSHQLDSYIRPCSTCPSDVLPLIEATQTALILNIAPALKSDGTGGTYLMKNAKGQISAVFKPTDEEPFAPMNPKNYTGKTGAAALRLGVLSGEAAYREVAAYLLDSEHFSSVPKTVLVECQHPGFYYGKSELYPKTGSLQEFVNNKGTVDEFSPSCFAVKEIQKICILDMKVLNMDRNESNILVLKEKDRFKLVPIDHGLSIPDTFAINEYDLCWMSWPQLKEPISPACLEHIEKIDPLSYLPMLKEEMPFRDICLRNIRVAALLLKKGAKAGLSLYNIGQMMYRKGFSDTPSVLEKVIEDSYDLYKTISKNLSSRLKLEKFLNDPDCSVRRPRASSTSEIDFEVFKPDSASKSLAQNTISDSFYHKVVTIAEVSEEEDRDLSDDSFEFHEEYLPSNPNFSFSSSGLESFESASPGQENDAFNLKLFYYIEAYLDVAVQKKVKDLMKNSIDGGRLRSFSDIFNEN